MEIVIFIAFIVLIVIGSMIPGQHHIRFLR